ncbi:ATP-grasp domain-containing protein [Rossellomorea aquimaris]|uniref:ATP-grasp domain-containing protein n=1 Tax=Rossellomorea aquimaris TaxID=189382 RepID=UPI001CD5FC19|nr:ATP-grasp domain-containing protein [Rossellomorea aquimaris]MCA1055308.1 ATP-grasp domain-containing protein [Rossellomorea aquimaris]
MSKRIMIVGAGYEQFPIIKRAKDRGMYVIAVDKNPDAYGFKYANEHHLISTVDHKRILDLATKKKVDAITSMITETPLRSIYEVGKELGLPSPSLSSVLASQSKYKMREYFKKNNIQNPKYIHATSINDGMTAAYEIGFPLVIKPTDKGGQVGLFKINSREQLSDEVIGQAIESSNKGEIIIEEFIEGDEINVVSLILNGQVVKTIASDRIKHKDKSFGVVLRHLYPCENYNKHIGEIKNICQKIADTLSIKNGIIFPQMIKGEDGLSVIEVGERIPGGIMKEVFEFATGYNLIDLQLDISLGEEIKLPNYKVFEEHPAITVKFLTADPGELDEGMLCSISGEENLSQMEVVKQFGFFQDPRNTRIRPLRNGSDRFYYIVCSGLDRDDAIKNSEVASNLLHFNIDTEVVNE